MYNLIEDEQVKCKLLIDGKKYFDICKTPPLGIAVVAKTKDDKLVFCHTKKYSELNVNNVTDKGYKLSLSKENLMYCENNNRHLIWFEYFGFASISEYMIKGYYKL